jgi:hypothetical protein
MDRNELIFVLAAGTLGLGPLWGLWQYFSVRRSQARRGEQPGAAAATEEMLHHRDRDPLPVGELQPARIARPRD